MDENNIMNEIDEVIEDEVVLEEEEYETEDSDLVSGSGLGTIGAVAIGAAGAAAIIGGVKFVKKKIKQHKEAKEAEAEPKEGFKQKIGKLNPFKKKASEDSEIIDAQFTEIKPNNKDKKAV